MDNPLVALGVSLLVTVIGAVAVFMLGRLSTRWDRGAAASERKREGAIQRRLDDVDSTRRAFEARIAALLALMEGDGERATRALDAVQEHAAHELLRHYGSTQLIQRWWQVSDRISATYGGTDRAQQGPPDPEWLHELRDVRSEVLAALRSAREAVAAEQPFGEQVLNDPALPELQKQRLERDRVGLQRAHEALNRDAILRAQAAAVHWTQRAHHQSETIHVADLPPGNEVVSGHVFEDCTLIGPAVLAFIDGVTFDQPLFVVSSPDAAFITWPPEKFVKPEGVVAFRNAVFRRCRFERITVSGSAADIQRLRESLPVQDDSVSA